MGNCSHDTFHSYQDVRVDSDEPTRATAPGLRGDDPTTVAGGPAVREGLVPSRRGSCAGRVPRDRLAVARHVARARRRWASRGPARRTLARLSDEQLAKVERVLAKGPTANGFRERTLDARSSRDGDRKGDRGQLFDDPDVVDPARATGVESPASRAKGRRGRPGRHRRLGQGSLARGKKNARRRRAWIVFEDESGFSLLPSVRATWAPHGKTPVLAHHFNWKRLSMASALAFAPGGTDATLVFSMQPGSFNDESLIIFLDEVHELLKRRQGHARSGTD